MTTDNFTEAARAEAFRVWFEEPTTLDTISELGAHMAEWARTHLAAQEPTEDDVQAAVAAILALTNETEETARMDDIDVAWDHARAALTAIKNMETAA